MLDNEAEAKDSVVIDQPFVGQSFATMAIDPMRDEFLYVVAGGGKVTERGRAFNDADLARIANANGIPSHRVRICCGWNAAAVLEVCRKTGWVPCKVSAVGETGWRHFEKSQSVFMVRETRSVRDEDPFADCEFMAMA